MNLKKTILHLVKEGKSFTNYDVLFLTRKSHPQTTARDVRATTRELAQSHPAFQNYHSSRIMVGDQSATLYHPLSVNPSTYEANELTQWEVTRTPDKDGRLSIPKTMLSHLPTGRTLGATRGIDFLLIHKEGTPDPSLKIQPKRKDLRINPSTLKESGILGKTYRIHKSHHGIRITQ